MKDLVKSAIAFVIGAAASAAALNSFYKSKYNAALDDEIAKTKAYYASLNSCDDNKHVKKEAAPKKAEKEEFIKATVPVVEANRIQRECGYTDYSAFSSKEEEDNDLIEYIPPEECGEEYDVIVLYWHPETRQLKDDGGFDMENFEERVGAYFPSHFGEYEDDVVYVRNHQMRTDYTIYFGDDEPEDIYK